MDASKPDSAGVRLQRLLSRPEDASAQDVALVLASLSSDTSAQDRALAFAVLARLLHIEGSSTSAIEARKLAGPVVEWLSEGQDASTCRALVALETIFEMHVASGIEVLSSSGVAEGIVDAVEHSVLASSLSKTSLNGSFASPKAETEDVILCTASFLSVVIGSKPSRDLLLARWPEATTWLCSTWTSPRASECAKSAAAVALAKLRLAPTPPAESSAIPRDLPSATDLARSLLDSLLSPRGSGSRRVVEGLALLSIKREVKQLVLPPNKNAADLVGALRSIVEPATIGPSSPSSTSTPDLAACYAVAALLVALTRRERSRGEEDAAKEKLRRMAAGQKHESAEAEPEELVSGRCRALLTAGVMAIVVRLAKSPSAQTRRAAGQLLLDLVEERDGRSEVIKAGGIKALLSILSEASTRKEPADLPSAQALAKLLITSNPLLSLGPSSSSPVVLSAVSPLVAMLVHPDASLLQTFEALMALTNLSSFGPEPSEQMARDPRFFAKIDSCMLEDHVLVRRAATELVCNLVSSSQTAWDRWTGEMRGGTGPQSVDGQKALKAAGNRIHLLGALCSVEDLPTRTAASGALATLTTSPLTCLSICLRPSIVKILVGLLSDEERDEGVRHRGAEVLKNMATFARESGSQEIRAQVEAAGVLDVLKRAAGRDGEADVVRKVASSASA